MSIIEIDAGTQIKKYEYVSENFDTYIVSSDDIDLSREGFVLKKRDFFYDRSMAEKESIYDGLPLRVAPYNMNIFDIKCKLVKKEDVIRYYDDWETSHSYFCGTDCTYHEMDGFIRIEPLEEPQGLINEFTYEEYYSYRGDQHPPLKHHRYYKNISYDNVKFQRDVITKSHKDYTINLNGITKDMNEEEKKQLLIEYLIKKVDKRGSDGFRPLLLGSYDYKIPDKLHATDLDSVFDIVLPRSFELCSTGDYSRSNFQRALIQGIVNSHWSFDRKGEFASDMLWFEEGKIIYPSKDYAYFMNIQLHLRLMDKHKNKEYPYNLLDLKKVYYWLERSYDEYLTRHNPVYWNNKLVCGDLGDYVKKAIKELIYFKQFD